MLAGRAMRDRLGAYFSSRTNHRPTINGCRGKGCKGVSNFILVHGAWLGAWAWDGVIRHMEGSRDSHSFGDVLAVDLPGHGQRFGDEIRRIIMEHYVEAVVTPTEVMRLDEVVLVGHGFAGTFLPRAAMELGHRVKGMVLVGADLPPRAGRPTTGCPGGTG